MGNANKVEILIVGARPFAGCGAIAGQPWVAGPCSKHIHALARAPSAGKDCSSAASTHFGRWDPGEKSTQQPTSNENGRDVFGGT